MNTRHPNNPNLSLLKTPFWDGLPVQSQQGMLIEDYLSRIHDVLRNALAEHRRTCVFRVDLKFPAVGYEPDTSVITRFIGSLKSQLHADASRKQREGQRVYPCTLRYIWVREQHTSSHWHYHVAILVNRDRFNSWGRFKSPSEYTLRGEVADGSTNMTDRMRKAWASALGISLVDSIGLVHFADSPYSIDVNADDFADRLNEVFHWLSYFAKVHTKHYGNRHRNFGCSQN
jgi:hypothetical protein